MDRVAHQLVATAQLQLAQDALHVVLDRAHADDQPVRDLGVRVALGDQPQHLGLTFGQVLPTVPTAGGDTAELAQDQRRQ